MRKFTIGNEVFYDVASVEQKVRELIKAGAKEVPVELNGKLDRVYFVKNGDVCYCRNN